MRCSPVDDAPPGTQSKYERDSSFWHNHAAYPRIIIKISHSHIRKRLSRSAEDCLLDSDASVQVVNGLDIEYDKKPLHKATLSVWRTHVVHTDDGNELRVVKSLLMRYVQFWYRINSSLISDIS